MLPQRANTEDTHMLSRRSFLNTSLGAGLVLAAPDVQQAVAQAPAPKPARRIVDAQVHLWKANTPDRPWPPNTVPQLPEPFGYDKLLLLMDEAGVERVVIVPPSWERDRIDYAMEAHAKYPTRFGVMGRIPLADPQSAALLPKWKEQPGMLGIRVSFNAEQTAGCVTAPPTGSGRPPRTPPSPSATRNLPSSSTTWGCRSISRKRTSARRRWRRRPRSRGIPTCR